MVGIQVCGLDRELPDLSTFPTGGEGSSCPGFVPPDDMVNSESVFGIKHSDSSVMVIGY